MGLDTKSDWLIISRNVTSTKGVTELVQGQLQVSCKLEEWAQKNF
jgi:hypothetical protein